MAGVWTGLSTKGHTDYAKFVSLALPPDVGQGDNFRTYHPKVSLCELFGIEFCALFGITRRTRRTESHHASRRTTVRGQLIQLRALSPALSCASIW